MDDELQEIDNLTCSSISESSLPFWPDVGDSISLDADIIKSQR